MNKEYEFISMLQEQASWKAKGDAKFGIYDDGDLHPAALMTYKIAHERYCREHHVEKIFMSPSSVESLWERTRRGDFDEED